MGERNRISNIQKAATLTLTFGLLLATATPVRTQTVSEHSTMNAADYILKRRIESAKEIIADTKALKAKAAAFHQRVDLQIAQATKLKGEAQILQIKPPILPANLHLNAAQLAAAQNQYNSDIKEFSAHAEAYNDHLKQFQGTVGECHANDVMLDNVIHKYDLHLEEFHLPVVRISPPHICGALGEVYGGDVSHIANSIMNDQLRVINAEQDLQRAEQKLQAVEGQAPAIAGKTVNAAYRASREQELAAEFGRLRQEYDLLKVERQRLANQSVITRATTSSLSAKLQKK